MSTTTPVNPAERLLRLNWMTVLQRADGAPAHTPDFVIEQGRGVQIVDVREGDELVGPLGHIPGVTWVPLAEIDRIAEELPADTLVVLVSRGEDRAIAAARRLIDRGMTHVAAMRGGMVAWKDRGFATTRSREVLERRGVLASFVSLAGPGASGGTLSIEDIRAHVGDVRSVRWMKTASLVLHGRLSCVDGRDDHGVIGAPGGDAGKFLLALATTEALTGREIDPQIVPELLLSYVDTFGHFYLHSDVHALNAFIGSMRGDRRLDAWLPPITSNAPEWRAFMAAPPAPARELILEHLLVPAHLGCGHLRLMLQRSEAYGIRPALVTAFLRAYFLTRWNGAPELDFVVLGGGHQEGAVVKVELDDEVWALSRVPLISPACGGTQMFVTHPQVAAWLDKQIARFMTREAAVGLTPADADRFAPAMGELARRQLGATLAELAKGLPVYSVRFHRDQSFTVSEG